MTRRTDSLEQEDADHPELDAQALGLEYEHDRELVQDAGSLEMEEDWDPEESLAMDGELVAEQLSTRVQASRDSNSPATSAAVIFGTTTGNTTTTTVTPNNDGNPFEALAPVEAQQVENKPMAIATGSWQGELAGAMPVIFLPESRPKKAREDIV